jgi:oligoribonuclease NrnB/cAMP/cGMP phosphodiesterase (DHH superfamily)
METQFKRIVTRPDFDGIVCAVIIREALKENLPVMWLEPGQVQTGAADIQPGDIIANLPHDARCSLWFDHHVSNAPLNSVPGAFNIAPSAAGVVYRYFQKLGTISSRYDELIHHADIIDAADLTMDQVLCPERYPHVLLSMTIQNNEGMDAPYWEHLVELLQKKQIREIMADVLVEKKCRKVIEENKSYGEYLKAHTRIHDTISLTDFRPIEKTPEGNRFLIYSLFPHITASIKVRYKEKEKKHVLLSIGKNIFNSGCRVNIGNLLKQYGGGGHDGAGGCTLDAKTAQRDIDRILEIMLNNQA